MAYTDEQKAEMYDSVSSDLTNVVLSLEDFMSSEPSETEVSEEVSFARSTRNQLVTLIGDFSVRAKRYEADE